MTTTPPEQPPTPDEGAATPPPLPPLPPAPGSQGWQGWQAPPPGWQPPAPGYGPGPGQPPAYGQVPPAYGQMPFRPAPPTEGLAVAAMVIGIAGLAGACMYGIGTLISPVALFLGRSSMKKIDASQGQLGGRGMAQAGFIMGIIGTVLLMLTIVAISAFIAIGVSGGFDSDFPAPMPSMEPIDPGY
jgi:hypothetical protein